MRWALRLPAAGMSLVLFTMTVPTSRGQFPIGMGFRGPGVPTASPAMTPQSMAGYGYGGGYTPFVGAFGSYQSGNSGYQAAAIASVPSAAYFTYGNTSYTTESPSPLPVYGGPRAAYAPLPPPTLLTGLLKVQVPLEAEVWLEGHRMRSNGALRHFRSPPLDPNKGYVYEVRARWVFDGKPVEDVRHVAIRAGGIVLVDFTHLDPLVPRPSQPAETPKPPAKKNEAPSTDKSSG